MTIAPREEHHPEHDRPEDQLRRRYDFLIASMQFLEGVSIKFHGLPEDSAIYQTILDEFGKSAGFDCGIHLLTKDYGKLAFFGTSVASCKQDAVKKTLGLDGWSLDVDITTSATYGRVVENNRYFHATVAGILEDVLPGNFKKLAYRVAKTLCNEQQEAALLPFTRNNEFVGVISITHPELSEHFIPTAKSFCRQLSIALESAYNATQSKLVEAALRASKGQLSNALQIARLGHWEYDVCNDRFTFSDEFYNIFRTSAECMGGYTMSVADYTRHFLHPDDAQMVAAEVKMAIETTDPHFSRQLEHRILFADKTVGIISVRIFVVKDAQGRTVTTYGVNQDITERRMAEEELNQYRHQLEELVTERTEELRKELDHRKHAEEELQKAQRLESLGILAGGIAHDFNNLLCGLFGFVDLARLNLGDDPTVRECLDEALGCWSRARDLTQQLLTFAKGGMPARIVLSLDPIIRKTARLTLSGSNVQCDFGLPSTLWTIKGDDGQLSQVFSNIILNSRQAMPNGGLITVTVGNEELRSNEIIDLPEGSYVKLLFVDRGVGIAGDVLSRVFDPFFTTKEAGTGLGLATSYSIIKKHGGHISINSKIGIGTVVTIYLPAFKGAVPIQTAKPPTDLKGSGRILFMDDEEALRKSVTMMLQNTGYELVCAKSGEEAIDLYKDSILSGKKFSAVILDLTVIGGMGGEKAIRKLIEIDPLVKGVVSSGYADSPVLSDPAAYGFVGDIIKPYVIDDLLRVLGTVLQN